MESKLPIPLWLVLIMFLAGIVAGVLLGYVVSDPPTSVAGSVRSNQNTQPPQKEKVKPAEKAKPKKADTTNTTTLINQKDKRLLANMTNGPVKRALASSITKLKPRYDDCIKQVGGASADLPAQPYLRAAFEAIGGMATMTELEVLCQTGGCRKLQSCMLKKMGESLIDFPVEDGTYEVVHQMGEKEKKKGK